MGVICYVFFTSSENVHQTQIILPIWGVSCPSVQHVHGVDSSEHKSNYPVRPITSSEGCVTKRSSKWLLTVMNVIVGNISNCIKNNVDIIQRLKNLNINFIFKIIVFMLLLCLFKTSIYS